MEQSAFLSIAIAALRFFGSLEMEQKMKRMKDEGGERAVFTNWYHQLMVCELGNYCILPCLNSVFRLKNSKQIYSDLLSVGQNLSVIKYRKGLKPEMTENFTLIRKR